MNGGKSSTNGSSSVSSTSDINEINELKSKFLKHRQILTSNYEQAESEIKRLDEIYHETVEQVLSVRMKIIDVLFFANILLSIVVLVAK